MFERISEGFKGVSRDLWDDSGSLRIISELLKCISWNLRRIQGCRGGSSMGHIIVHGDLGAFQRVSEVFRETLREISGGLRDILGETRDDSERF